MASTADQSGNAGFQHARTGVQVGEALNLAESALQPSDIASGAITPKTGNLDLNNLGGAGAFSTITDAPDGDIVAAVGTLYVVDQSTYTAPRTLTLPATAAVGDRVGVVLKAGCADYSTIIQGNAGQSINNGSVASEWSRLFICGEYVELVCTGANTLWAVAVDRRIPMAAKIGHAAGDPWLDNTATTPNFDTIIADNANIADLANNRINIRRACNPATSVLEYGAVSAANAGTTGAYAGQVSIMSNGDGAGLRVAYPLENRARFAGMLSPPADPFLGQWYSVAFRLTSGSTNFHNNAAVTFLSFREGLTA
jgi:hypothetical protein